MTNFDIRFEIRYHICDRFTPIDILSIMKTRYIVATLIVLGICLLGGSHFLDGKKRTNPVQPADTTRTTVADTVRIQKDEYRVVADKNGELFLVKSRIRRINK